MNTLNRIGNTPLIRFSGSVQNNNRIWFKLECENPFGSHYDRVYLKLFNDFEERGLLKSGMTVLETTSGSAGVSFAAIGKLLGYKCLVAIPEGGERAREEAIKREGAEIIYTPAADYISGFPWFVKRFLVTHKDVVFLNHSTGLKASENVVTTSALAGIGRELLGQLGSVDCFIAGVGNGSSILGPARVLKNSRIVAFESFQSAVAYDLLYPGKYEEEFGVESGILPRHRLPGTSYRGIDFPHIRIAVKEERLVDEVVLVSDNVTDEQYRDLTGRTETIALPHWDAQNIPYGRTTRAGLAVGLQVAANLENSDIVVLAYDKADRYDYY